MNVLPILEMLSNELFIFFYENILDEKKNDCLLDICQNSRRERVENVSESRGLLFSFEQGQIQCLCFRFRKPVHGEKKNISLVKRKEEYVWHIYVQYNLL